MTRVAVITTVAPERCGNRTYGEEILRWASSPECEISLIGRPFDGNTIYNRTAAFDVVHILLGVGLWNMTHEHVNAMRQRGQKVILTLHEYPCNMGSDFVNSFDKVLVHQKEFKTTATDVGWGWWPTFEFLAHGIPINENLPEYTGELSDYIGTFGFPVSFKQYPLAAQLAKAVGKKIYAILPGESYGAVEAVSTDIRNYCPGSVIDTSFPSHDEALAKLAQCAFMLFPYHHTAYGIGGSARAGVGARRPCVISRVVRFQDWLEDYRDEFYVIEDPYPRFETALPVVQQALADFEAGTARIPNRAFADQNWKVVGKQFEAVYRSWSNGNH